MTAPFSHFGEELQDLLDGRLDESDRSRVEQHLATCAQCRRELEALRWVKVEALGQLPAEELPEAVMSRVQTALATQLAESRNRAGIHARSRSLSWALASGLLAVAAVVLFVVLRPPPGSLPERVAADFAAVAAGRLPLGVEGREPRVIEGFFARNGVPFATRVFDLGMMRYDLLGGRVHRVDGRVSALFAYRGADGSLLVCQMYAGTAAELPPPDETRVNNGITFYVYRRGGTTVVFWHEGDVVCVLASDAAPDVVIQLAFAKASKV